MAEYTIFQAQVPDDLNNTDNDDYSLGTVVNIAPTTFGGRVIRARHYATTTPPTSPIIWHLSDNATLDGLGSHTFVDQTPGWVEEAITPPIDIPPEGGSYVVWIGTPNRYVATGTYFTTGTGAAGVTNGPLTAPASAADPQGIGNGRFGGDDESVPQGTINGGNYYVDLVFEPNAAPAAEGSAALTVDLAIASSGQADRAGAAAVGLALTVAAAGDAPDIPPNEGSAALALVYSLAGEGETPPIGQADGQAALQLALTVAATGDAPSVDPSEGAAALSLAFAVAVTGDAPDPGAAEGQAALGLSYSLSGTGETPTPGEATGVAALGLVLTVATAGNNPNPEGAAALGIVFTVATTGDNGTPFRCRPVRSFAEVMS